MLVALSYLSCVFPRLLLVCDVESALSVLGGGGGIMLPANAACAQALSCCAEFSRWLNGEAGGHVDHVGRYRRVGR
jgi:hypothetical protein